MSKGKNIDDLRALLFETIEGVKNGTMDLERAETISTLSQVMVNSAKVEVDYAKVTGIKGERLLGQAARSARRHHGRHTTPNSLTARGEIT